MDRRTFLNWVGLGLIANSLPVAIVACAPKSEETQTSEFRQIGTLAQLDKDGQILDEQVANSPVLVVRNATKSDDLVAINPTCTHRDCLVNWQQTENVFLCSCHDSKFDTAGRVLTPPAEEALAVREVKVEGDRILVKVPA